MYLTITDGTYEAKDGQLDLVGEVYEIASLQEEISEREARVEELEACLRSILIMSDIQSDCQQADCNAMVAIKKHANAALWKKGVK